MTSNRRASAHDWCAKTWNEEFSKDRGFKEDSPWIKKTESLGAADDEDITLVMRESLVAEQSYIYREVEYYCQGARIEDVEIGHGEAGQRRAAWLDDTTICGANSGGRGRVHENLLTATGLFNALKEKRWNHDNLSDADRRLIYIENLDPHYILALGYTMAYHQRQALRNAFYMHLASETSISIKIPGRRFPIFQMALHVPYYELRELSSSTPGSQPGQFIDVSFLDSDVKRAQDNNLYGIYEGRFSLLICGPDHFRWTGFAFVDRNSRSDGEESSEDDSEVEEDPIASPSGASRNFGIVDANMPIHDPRKYFLLTAANRMTVIMKEWQNVVRWIERNIGDHDSRYSSNLSHEAEARTRHHDEDDKQAFDWTQQTLKVLRQLLERLSQTTEAMDGFMSDKGDIAYLSSLCSLELDAGERHARHSITEILETLEGLEFARMKLLRLEKFCQDSAGALMLRMNMESKKATQQSGVYASYTSSIIFPLTFAATCFSMGESVIPFQMNFRSFLIVTCVMLLAFNLLFSVLGQIWLWNWSDMCLKAVRLDWLRASCPCSANAVGECLRLKKTKKDDEESIAKSKMDETGPAVIQPAAPQNTR